jgi:ribosome maturation factor RimP
MEIIEQITAWCDEFLTEEYFLVEVEHKLGSKKLGVYIDGDEAVDITVCQKLSRFLSEKLDEVDFGAEPYMLEVSSSGADSPLLVKRQYPKHIGREFFVKLKAETELTGRLEEVTEDYLLLSLKDKKKGYVNATQKQVPFADIAEASIILSFK